MTTIPFGRESALSQLVWAAVGFIATLDRRVSAYRERRNAIEALHKLDDRELSDIGIYRSHIEAAVNGDLPVRERA